MQSPNWKFVNFRLFGVKLMPLDKNSVTISKAMALSSSGQHLIQSSLNCAIFQPTALTWSAGQLSCLPNLAYDSIYSFMRLVVSRHESSKSSKSLLELYSYVSPYNFNSIRTTMGFFLRTASICWPYCLSTPPPVGLSGGGGAMARMMRFPFVVMAAG